MTKDEPERTTAEFGPSGYLPERAARRARKIVLRAPMGLQWPIAAGVAAVVVLVLGVAFVVTQTGSPRAPYVPTVELASVPPASASEVPVTGGNVLLVRTPGGVQAFGAPDAANPDTTPPTVRYCDTSRLLEASDGRVWALDGRLLGGTGGSLSPRAVRVHDGVVYVDPRERAPAPTVTGSQTAPACM